MAVNGNYTALVQVKVSDRELERQLKKVGENIKPFNVKVKADVDKNLGNASKVTKDLTQNINEANSSTKALGQSFLDITSKVAKFGISAKIIREMSQSVVEAKDIVLDFDSALTEFVKVSDLSGQALDDYTAKLGVMGEEVFRSKTNMLESVTEFKKTGATEEDASHLAVVAEMYRNIADEQISSGDSAGFLTSQMKAFNITADESMHIIDSVNEVKYCLPLWKH